jgi:arylsulfatase A-like enzyme
MATTRVSDPAGPPAQQGPAARPNLLLIVADQLRADILPCYGGRICQAPHLAALAAQSVVFERAYTPQAVCAPARASLVTGRYPHNHRVTGNAGRLLNGVLPDHPSLLSRRLERLGYERWYGGKWHLGGPENLPRDLGLPGQQFPGHGGGGYRYPEYEAYLACHGWTIAFASGPRQIGEHRYGTLAGPLEADVPHFLVDEALAFLRRWRQGGLGEGSGREAPQRPPFFLWLNFWGPHEPYFAPQALLDQYRDVAIPPWPDFAPNEVWPAGTRAGPRVHDLKRPTDSFGRGWDYWEPAVRHYFAAMTMIDYEIGRLLAALEDLGQLDNTVIVFTADHGESLGAHGLQDKGYFMYECIYRVPLLVRAPSARPRREGALVSLIDLCPTLLDLAGDPDPETGRDGVSLVPLLQETERGMAARRPVLVAEFHGMLLPYTQRMVTDGRWKYVWNMGDLDECYDLAEDPWEQTNLAPARPVRQRELQRELLAWMERTGDPARAYYARHLECGERQWR